MTAEKKEGGVAGAWLRGEGLRFKSALEMPADGRSSVRKMGVPARARSHGRAAMLAGTFFQTTPHPRPELEEGGGGQE
jgi:hypothetical protein